MTLTTLTSRTSFYGDGLTRSFPLPFKIWATSDLKIYLHNTATLSDVLQNLNTDYTVDSGAPASFGGVTFNTPPPSGSIVVLLRDMPLTQELDLVASGAFAAENIEIQLDKLAAEMQTLRELIARSLRLPVGAALSELALPEPTPARANQLLGVSSAGDSYDLKVLANLTLQTVSPFAAALLDDPDAATARATLGIGTSIDLNLLVPDTTGGASSDFVPFIDASEANASNKVPVPNFFSNAIAGSTATLPIDGSAFELLARCIKSSYRRPALASKPSGSPPLRCLRVQATERPWHRSNCQRTKSCCARLISIQRCPSTLNSASKCQRVGMRQA
jgi:hypothetical protein